MSSANLLQILQIMLGGIRHGSTHSQPVSLIRVENLGGHWGPPT